jgi:exodeoxyribonuclease V alpha subunit
MTLTSVHTPGRHVTEVIGVTSLRSTNEAGGAIFSGIREDGTKVTVIASHRSLSRPPVVGESWRIEGDYRENPVHGWQLHAKLCAYTLPKGRLISQFLANSPAFEGLGRTKATRLWEALGENLGRVLDEGDTAALTPPLTTDLATRTVETWRAIRSEAELVSYLDAYGFDLRSTAKLQRAWGKRALATLRANPYLMLAFSGWRIVDAAAAKLGVAKSDIRRLVGAVESCLYDRLTLAHTLTQHDKLQKLVGSRIGSALAEQAISHAIEELAIIGSRENGYQPVGAAALERGIEKRLAAILAGEVAEQNALLAYSPDGPVTNACMLAAEARQGFPLNTEQRAAVHMVMTNAFSLLTGGAGVGKTTVLNVVLAVAERLNIPVVQMALAGRAAKRMSEATGRPAMTIAKFLLSVRSGDLALPAQTLIIVDESSMIDLSAMYRILRALPGGSRLVLVGDSAQLPPISFGLVFHRLAESSVPRTHLYQVHRQAASTGIPAVAAAIRAHTVPSIPEFAGQSTGVSFRECGPESVIPALLDLARHWGGEEYQILCATKEQQRAINLAFHDAFCGERRLSGWTYAVGDAVIHLVNDYERGLMNGTLGRIIDVVDGALIIDFEGDTHTFQAGELSERLSLAYAISVHKSQGSQFRRVAVVSQPSRIYDHALVYTALTRAVEQAVLVGDRAAFELAVLNPPAALRREVGFCVSEVPVAQEATLL